MPASRPSFGEMIGRVLMPERQSRAARSVEWFGWFIMVLGTIMLNAPYFTARVLKLPALDVQGSDYLRLAGLLVSGLGLLYIVAGRLNSTEFAVASMLDRPLVPVIMLVLWYKRILPGPLALTFSASDFGSFLWTMASWRADAREGPRVERPRLFGRVVARLFGFTSGVVRNSRTFHPDGRTFRGSVRPLATSDAGLMRGAAPLGGPVLLRIGMGLMKKGMPEWLTRHVPDAPSVAVRVFAAAAAVEGRIERRAGEDLDLLFTAGGDRLWKLVLNLSTGGRKYGLTRYDYFQNRYFVQVPYLIDAGRIDVWLRLVPGPDRAIGASSYDAGDDASREAGLTDAVARRASLTIEAQRVGDASAPFVPIAEIRFEEEIEIDQEALHFDPVEGRGFTPHGFLTNLRKCVYPASVQSRPPTRPERARREHEGVLARLSRFFGSAR